MSHATFPHHYTGRLQRLLLLINDIKTNPCQTPAALYASLGVSRAMFYKDRQALRELGFVFRLSLIHI